MSLLLIFVEYAYIVGRIYSIAYTLKLFANLCSRQFIKADCFSVWLYPRNCDFAFKDGSEMEVWSLLPLLDVNGSRYGRTLSRQTLCSGSCIIWTICWKIYSLSSSPFALKSQEKLRYLSVFLSFNPVKNSLNLDIAFLKECANLLCGSVASTILCIWWKQVPTVF